MKTPYKIALVAVPLAVVSFVLGRVIWPDPVGMVGPDVSLIPHFMFISAIESIAFGTGIAFAIFGWLSLQAQLSKDKLSLAAFVSSIWLLISWWPHDNMHRVNGMDNFVGLIRIEYIFHFTLVIAGLIVARYLWREFSKS